MKKVGLSMLVLLLGSAGLLRAEVHYTASSLRDPFGGQPESQKPVDESLLVEKKLRTLIIQGVVASVKNPRAIINGKIYRVGSEPMPGIRIARIDKDGVYVMAGQKEVLLNRQTQTIKGKTADAIKKS